MHLKLVISYMFTLYVTTLRYKASFIKDVRFFPIFLEWVVHMSAFFLYNIIITQFYRNRRSFMNAAFQNFQKVQKRIENEKIGSF